MLSALAVPSGTTLDLSGLVAGTHVSELYSKFLLGLTDVLQVVFEGETTFDYEEVNTFIISSQHTFIRRAHVSTSWEHFACFAPEIQVLTSKSGQAL